jgi:hypothetical protein
MPDLFSGGFGVTPEYLLPRRILTPSSGTYKMPFYLFEFFFTDTLRYTDTDLTVVWSGNIYNPVPIAISGFEKSSLNFAETLTTKTQNVDRAIAAIVLGERIQGKEAAIYVSEWMAPGSFANPSVVFKGQFDGISIEEGYDSADVSLGIKNEFVKWDMPVPRSTFAGTCQWKFKSGTPGCQYTGAASLCNKTWERCQELSNVNRFRGFRWLPMLQDKEIWWGKNPPKGA